MPHWRPPHVYVPGQTPRHPEDLFDAIKATVEGVSPDQIEDCAAWQAGLAFLKDGYFWEAHEVLEAVWMACPPNAPEKLMVQAVIQLANARLKTLMGRDAAAERLQEMAKQLAREAVQRAGGAVLGIDSRFMHYFA